MNKEVRKNQPPLLLTSHGQAYAKQSFYSLLKNRYRTTCIPVLCNKRVLASTHGWLALVHRSTDDCTLFNPESMETIELPRLHQSNKYKMCVLSKPPTEPDCYILFISTMNKQSFCKIGDEEFVHHSITDNSLMAIASFQGMIYGLVLDYRFVIIDLDGKKFVMRPIMNGGQPLFAPQPSPNWVDGHEEYLVESPCSRELLLVIKMYRGAWIKYDVEFRVFRVSINGMECDEVEDIGELTVFVGDIGSGFCCSSSGIIKPNSIYYLGLTGRDMYVYDLVDRSTCSLLPCTAAGRYESANYWVDIQDDALNRLIDHQ